MAGSRAITVEFIGKDKSAGKTASAVEQKFGKLGGRLDRVGQAAGKVLLGGTVLAAGALVKMGQAAAEDEAAQKKLEQQLHNSAGASDSQIAATERWISAQGKALGVADDELRPAMGKLVAATHDVGKSQELAALAMDISAGTGKNLGAVTDALVKAQNGSVGGLSRLGVATKDAHGKTKDLKDITADLAQTYGGQAAKAAETTAGKQKRLQVAFGELQEEIGARVLPAMVKLSEIGLKMVDWIGKNQRLVGTLVAILGGLAAVVYAVSLAMRVWAAANAAWAAVSGVVTAAQWAFNAALAANPIGLVIIAVAALGVALIVLFKKSSTFRAGVTAAFGAVKRAAQFAWNFIKAKWPLLLGILTGPIGLAVILIIRNWNKIKAATAAVWNAIKGAVSKAWQGIKSAASNGFNWLMSTVKSLPGRIKSAAGGLFLGAGKFLISQFVNGMKNASGIISGISSNVWSAVKSLLNGAIGKLRSALNFTIGLPGPDIHVNVGSSIPYLAKGGVVRARKGGTLALIGEGGHDEAVIPLSGPHAPRLGGGVTIVINGGLDSKESIGRTVVQAIKAYERTSGQRVLPA